jgi:hypothetical protein
MTTISESLAHHRLVLRLMEYISRAGYSIIQADGVQGYRQPDVLRNVNGLGDGQDKQPDIIGYNAVTGVYANGEVKLGEDMLTEHSKTQFALFSTLINKANNAASVLFIGIPAVEKVRLDGVLSGLSEAVNLSNIQTVIFS